MVIKEISYVYVMVKINNIDIDLKFEMGKKGNSRVLGFIYFIDILKILDPSTIELLMC